jgi:hypothetical protein
VKNLTIYFVEWHQKCEKKLWQNHILQKAPIPLVSMARGFFNVLQKVHDFGQKMFDYGVYKGI